MASLTGNLGLRKPAPNDPVNVQTDLSDNFDLIDKSLRNVVNVMWYGAVGDDETDDLAAITSAIAACPEGGTVFFPPGIYRVSGPVVLHRNRTYMGTHRPRWFYRAGAPCTIKPTDSFSGEEIIHIPDKEIIGSPSDNDGGRIFNLSVNGNSQGSTVRGIRFHGLVRDWHVKDVDVSQTSGNGFVCDGYQRADLVTYYPRGMFWESPTCYSAGNSGGAGNGFFFSNLTDSTIQDALAVSCESIGFLIDNPGEFKLVASRAVFNKSDGLRVTGTVTVGGFQVVNFSTDRNGNHGIRITALGTQPIQLLGILNRRDGATVAEAAGVAILGTDASNKTVPVEIVGLSQTVGVDDGGGGTASPAYGLKMNYCQSVIVMGQAWGMTNAVLDQGGVTNLNIVALYRRKDTPGTVDTLRISSQPTLATLASNGTSPPAPVLAADADDIRGSLTFGSGSGSPAAGSQVSVTFARPYAKAPVVVVVPTNGPAASRAPYASSITTTGFNVALNSAAAASQPNTTYGVGYTVTP